MDAALELQLIPKSLTAQAQIQHTNKSLQPCLWELTPVWESRAFRTIRHWYFVPSRLYYILVLLWIALNEYTSAKGIPFLDCWKGQDSYFKIN